MISIPDNPNKGYEAPAGGRRGKRKEDSKDKENYPVKGYGGYDSGQPGRAGGGFQEGHPGKGFGNYNYQRPGSDNGHGRHGRGSNKIFILL